MNNTVLCPVCELHNFASENDFDICPLCGWENDGVQMNDHDYWGGANELTVNESKVLYEISMRADQKNALKVITERHKSNQKALSKKYLHLDWNVDGEKASSDYRKEHDRYYGELLSLWKE